MVAQIFSFNKKLNDVISCEWSVMLQIESGNLRISRMEVLNQIVYINIDFESMENSEQQDGYSYFNHPRNNFHLNESTKQI